MKYLFFTLVLTAAFTKKQFENEIIPSNTINVSTEIIKKIGAYYSFISANNENDLEERYKKYLDNPISSVNYLENSENTKTVYLIHQYSNEINTVIRNSYTLKKRSFSFIKKGEIKKSIEVEKRIYYLIEHVNRFENELLQIQF